MRYSICLMVVLLCRPIPVHAADWPQWRGPGHNNIVPDGKSVPTEWSESKNVLWQTNVPGRGHSSPIVAGNLIVLTSADERSQAQAIIGFDRNTGDQKWATLINRGGFPKIHDKNTHASPTVAAANGLFYATFCHHGKVEAVAVNETGEIAWKQDVGPYRPKAFEYGYAASPTIYENSLIVTGSCDTSGWMKSLDLGTGRQLWQKQRPQVLNWASPIVAKLAGREQLVISGGHMISGYDPGSGHRIWSANCLTMATCGTCVWTDDIVIASGGYPDPETAAVVADGSGRVLWTNRVKCYEQSLLCHERYVYALADNGVAYCWNARSGKEMWKKRLKGPVSASPLLAGGNIYVPDEKGTMFIFGASPERFQAVARNHLGNESFATPTAADNVLYLRVAHRRRNERQEVLYAIAEL